MKILILSNLYPPNIVGGYEVLCHNVAAGLVACGDDVTVLTSCYGGRVASADRQTVHQGLRLAIGRTIYDGFDGSARDREILDRDNANALRRAIDLAEPDVLFCWNLYGLGRRFFEAIVSSGIPACLMLTDNWLIEMMQPERLAEYFRKEVFGSPGTSANAFPARHAAPPIPASAIFGAVYMQSLHERMGLTFQSSAVVHNGVSQSDLRCSPFPDRSRIGDTVRLLFAGRVVEIKGVLTAIEALAQLPTQKRRFELTIVGDSRDEAYVQKLKDVAAQAGCLDRIAFRSPVASNALEALFDAHDIYVFPSLYEPFSLTLIHALAAGIPTVASRVGGNVEIIREEQTGLLFDRGSAAGLKSAILRLVENDGLRAQVALQGREAAKHFTDKRMLDGIRNHLHHVAG